MEFPQILSDVKRRPGAYGLDGGYREFVAFINGANAAHQGRLLQGFSSFLAGKLGEGENLYWSLLVAKISMAPHLVSSPDDVLGSNEGVAIECLFREILEFLEQRWPLL
ncbi:hypothetical protein [Streptomyces sp. SCL15-4]|uniref:hypothetical protein n=1 Tax=Streptomyces sp. SCL15-4 TaxID=2967221 RepID=UPI002966B503|nr:hypothetical protein [Streptomyces sp. SCL15-4]